MRCLNSFLSHSFRSAEISLTRNITPVFLLRFVLKGGIVFRPISPPTIGIKCVFALVGRVWSWQRSFTAAAGAIYCHQSSQRNFVKLSQSPTCNFIIIRASTLYILIYKDTMPIQCLMTVNPLVMIDCQLCGKALGKCPRMGLLSKYCENFHDIWLRALAAIYHRTAAALTHPPCSPSTRYKTIISASSSQYEQTSYTDHTFELNPTLNLIKTS